MSPERFSSEGAEEQGQNGQITQEASIEKRSHQYNSLGDAVYKLARKEVSPGSLDRTPPVLDDKDGKTVRFAVKKIGSIEGFPVISDVLSKRQGWNRGYEWMGGWLASSEEEAVEIQEKVDILIDLLRKVDGLKKELKI